MEGRGREGGRGETSTAHIFLRRESWHEQREARGCTRGCTRAGTQDHARRDVMADRKSGEGGGERHLSRRDNWGRRGTQGHIQLQQQPADKAYRDDETRRGKTRRPEGRERAREGARDIVA